MDFKAQLEIRYTLKASTESCLESNNIIRSDFICTKKMSFMKMGLVKKLELKYVKKILPPVCKLLENGRPH